MKTPDQLAHQREYVAAWRKAHPEKRAAYREHRSLYNEAYQLANRDRLLERRRLYWKSHPERKAIIGKEWQQRNRGKVAVSNRKWKQAHRDKLREYGRKAQKVHQEERRWANAARRARQSGNGGSHTLVEWRDKCALLGNVCFYCGESRPLTIDHNVPISRGGQDDITNILPACGPCNARKQARTAQEFLSVRYGFMTSAEIVRALMEAKR